MPCTEMEGVVVAVVVVIICSVELVLLASALCSKFSISKYCVKMHCEIFSIPNC